MAVIVINPTSAHAGPDLQPADRCLIVIHIDSTSPDAGTHFESAAVVCVFGYVLHCFAFLFFFVRLLFCFTQTISVVGEYLSGGAERLHGHGLLMGCKI